MVRQPQLIACIHDLIPLYAAHRKRNEGGLAKELCEYTYEKGRKYYGTKY